MRNYVESTVIFKNWLTNLHNIFTDKDLSTFYHLTRFKVSHKNWVFSFNRSFVQWCWVHPYPGSFVIMKFWTLFFYVITKYTFRTIFFLFLNLGFPLGFCKSCSTLHTLWWRCALSPWYSVCISLLAVVFFGGLLLLSFSCLRTSLWKCWRTGVLEMALDKVQGVLVWLRLARATSGKSPNLCPWLPHPHSDIHPGHLFLECFPAAFGRQAGSTFNECFQHWVGCEALGTFNLLILTTNPCNWYCCTHF